MKILLLTHAFNGLAQRLYVELRERGHELSVEFDINDTVTREAIDLFQPELVIAPFLKRAIPEDVWRRVRCLVVHPGIRGDRGPSALDWAIRERTATWGVTLLQADAEMDAGDTWAERGVAMREAAIIGEVIEDEHAFVQMDTAFGGRRVVDWLTGDQLPRIC